MPEPLHRMAAEVEGDPFFLAGLLTAFAQSEQLDAAALSVHLGCPPEQLPRLKLCRAPHPEPERMRAGVTRIAAHFGLDETTLRRAVLRGRVVLAMRQGGDGGMLLAARDRETES